MAYTPLRGPEPRDLILALSYNFYGDRLVTASADHHLRVYDKIKESWNLVDAWRAHDAEVTDTKWSHPLHPATLASLSEDGTLKLWIEDPSHPLRSGRRFRRACPPILTKSKLPWTSFDFCFAGSETYLALITRDGNLAIFEPRDHDRLDGEWSDWMGDADFWVCPPPPRSVEASFRVSWHKEAACWTAVAAGLPRTSLGIAVAAMSLVRVYRTDAERRLYIAAELKGAKDLVRDVAWANGSMRGWDVIATASKDGGVRVYELRTEVPRREDGDDGVAKEVVRQSGIGAGLAGTRGLDAGGDPSRVRQVAHCVAELREGRGGMWRCEFNATGDVLTTSGDDGILRTYKRGIDMKWTLFAELDSSSTAE